jgi:TetR/AcrR family transcriptional repressor of bet genes
MFILTDQSIKIMLSCLFVCPTSPTHPTPTKQGIARMPRIGAEPERRKALITAAIAAIGEHGSLDVSVKEIARQAGMSSALAFHYFGGKDEIVLETMRYLLREFSKSVIEGLNRSHNAAGRVDTLICASFSPDQFDRKTVAAWLVFYLKAYSSPQAARLLGIYQKRLKSNLVNALKTMTGPDMANDIADGLGALIDGLYIRQALAGNEPDATAAISICRAYVRASFHVIPVKGQHTKGVH